MITRRSLLSILITFPAISKATAFNFQLRDKHIDKTVNSVADIKYIDLFDGMIVKTRGFYYPEKESSMLYRVIFGKNVKIAHSIKVGREIFIIPIYKDIISFKQLGLKMDGHHDDTLMLRKILANEGQYYFNEGHLIVKNHIELGPNVRVIGSGMATSIIEYRNTKNSWLFINGEKGNPNFIKRSGYSGRGNYFLSDFSINLRGDLAEKSRSAMIFGRSKNVFLHNIHFYNGKNSHRVECNAQEDFTISNCIFSDTIISQSGSHEEINIDYNNKSGFPAYGSWDNSSCKRVNILSCKFINVQKGVASHSNPEKHHQSIIISDCLFKNTSSNAIQLQAIDNSFIENCTFIDCKKTAIRLINAHGNTIKNIHSDQAVSVKSDRKSTNNHFLK